MTETLWTVDEKLKELPSKLSPNVRKDCLLTSG